MILRKIHNVGQRYFPIPSYIALWLMCGYSTYKGFTSNFIEWAGAMEASLPFGILMLRIQIKKNMLRTNRGPVGAFTVSGVLWVLIYSAYHHQISWTPLWLSIASALIFFIDTYAYNFLDRRIDQEGLALGKIFPEMEMKDYQGTVQNTKQLLTRPALILFIRGSWCPLCMAQVKEVAGLYKELDDRGIRVIVVTPEKQESSFALAKMHQVPILYLVDDELKLAKMLSLVHKNGVPIGLPRDKFGNDTIFPTAILTNEIGAVIYVDQTDDITIRPEPATFTKIFDEYKVNHELELKIQERTADIRDLLDNIGEGFFSFGADFSIHKEKSQACDMFFGTDIKYKDPILLFKVPKVDSTKQTFRLAFEGSCDLSLIRDLLPKEVMLEEKIFELKYKWIAHATEIAKSKVLVIMKDVTRERKLAAKFAAEEEFNNMIVRVAIDQEGFIQLLAETQTLLANIDAALARPDSSPAKPIDVNELFRLFHTIKGGMSIFGLKKVTKHAHDIENQLAPIRNNNETITEVMRSQIQNQVEELKTIIKNQLDELKDLISQEDLSPKEKFFKVSASQISLLSSELLSELPKEYWERVISKMEGLRKQPLKAALKRLITLAKELAPRLDKKVAVTVSGDETLVFHDKLEPVFGALVHLIRNSIDHGLETPDERVAEGKPEEGTLNFKAFRNNRDLRLVISDDGRGVNIEAVKNVALKKKLLDQEALDQLPDQQAIELIFSPGFSTKAEVTDISGRGVGMNAVKTAVEELSGVIHILSREGKGTEFEILIPNVA